MKNLPYHCYFFLFCLIWSTKSLGQAPTSYPLKTTATIVKSGYYPFPGMEQETGWLSWEYLFEFNKLYDVEFKISNVANRNVYFWAMTCSWEASLTFDNSFVRSLRWACNYNFPALNELKPGESKTFQTAVYIDPIYNYTYLSIIEHNKLAATKLGLIIVDSFYRKDLSLFLGVNASDIYEYSKEKKNQIAIIWSNPLNFL